MYYVSGGRGTKCQEKKASSTMGMIFGIIGGIVGVIVLCLCAVYFCTSDKNTNHTAMQVSMDFLKLDDKLSVVVKVSHHR